MKVPPSRRHMDFPNRRETPFIPIDQLLAYLTEFDRPEIEHAHFD